MEGKREAPHRTRINSLDPVYTYNSIQLYGRDGRMEEQRSRLLLHPTFGFFTEANEFPDAVASGLLRRIPSTGSFGITSVRHRMHFFGCTSAKLRRNIGKP
jgi:hypothetical protein